MSDKAKLTFSKPENESLEAYKAWITGTVEALGGDPNEAISNAEWESAWKYFWSKEE